ncbi:MULTISPECIES: preprotein translocase subunit SecE [Limnobacter]|uniref:Protein translocase subunit SecE n=1 Tax=Limnobacter litoralis TaxID=481366 RepID=A0ABQ5YQB6_9BURK|nr:MULTISPECIES: preprotein translocase subunit SecE [Limnobacter]GLR25545.1 protein translocase subunit SecE [Limnobacter litoralis]HEX5486315.1 preprotein translocase subunit SecE [Limnobacter sp.]
MAQNDIQTVSTFQDKALLALAVVFAVGGAIAFQVLSAQDFFIRTGVVLLGIVLAVVCFVLSQTGKRFVGFAKDSINEAKRVVWPTRKEGLQMTGVVFAFVAIMAVYLLVVDKTLEYVLYDLILGWTR